EGHDPVRDALFDDGLDVGHRRGGAQRHDDHSRLGPGGEVLLQDADLCGERLLSTELVNPGADCRLIAVWHETSSEMRAEESAPLYYAGFTCKPTFLQVNPFPRIRRRTTARRVRTRGGACRRCATG